MALMEGTRDNIKDIIKDNPIVIFDFWAAWCGPCKRFAPIFEAAATKHPDIAFVKIDTEAQPEISEVFEIRSIPTIAVIKEQDIIFVQPGAVGEDIFEQIIVKTREVDMEQVRSENNS